MTCYHPNSAYISGTRKTGTKIISFGLPQNTKQQTLKLPCGQCIGCKLDHAKTWAVRSMHEASLHDDNCFITTTYNNENLPHDNSLTPVHFTNFLKRLRKNVGTFRYLMCGEYGTNPINGKIDRPHYHALIFGLDFADRQLHSECEGIITDTSAVLEKNWKKGFCTVGSLTLESAQYVARYTLKKITASQTSKEEYHQHYSTTCAITGNPIQLQPEYSNCSRGQSTGQGGIGKTWYEKYHSDIFPHDTCIYQGRNIKTPRYYENLLRSADVNTFDKVKAQRKLKALAQFKDNTPERLRARETCTQQKLQNFTYKRDLNL